MKRFSPALPRMTAPPQLSRFTPEFKEHFCCVRLTCRACGRLIKPEDGRQIEAGMLVHEKEQCIEAARESLARA